MSEERKRIPAECKNRTDNNFRCALNANGTPKAPDANGADCADCNKYEYIASGDPQKVKRSDGGVKKGNALGTVALAVAAVVVAAGIFALTLLMKSCIV